MAYSLGLQATYTHIDIGVFQDDRLLLSVEKDKILASRELVPTCAALLMEIDLSLSDIAYITVNKGPAPFTSLRTVIATANGLAYALKIPLVGIDGLEVLLDETSKHYAQTEFTPIVVLHAFGNDVYCGYTLPDGTTSFECLPLPTFIEKLTTMTTTSYVLVGNGASIHQALLKESLGNRFFIPEMTQPYASLAALNEKAWHLWQAGTTCSQVQPLYLKKTL